MSIQPDVHVVSILAGRLVGDENYRTVRPGGSASWLLVVTESGKGRFGNYDLAPGEAGLMPPQTPQSYRTAEGATHWDIRYAHFHPRAEWAPLLTVRHVVLGDEAGPVAEAMELARSHASLGGDPYEEWLAMGALEAALVRIRRVASREEARGDSRVIKASEFARRHLTKPIGPQEMARAAGISASRLGDLFREEVGESPRSFVERLRLERARQLLAMSDLPVRLIAIEVGFASEFYFANRFRRAVGLSPTAYRVQSRETNEKGA